jgi:pyruvate carboxylase subunit B
VGIQLTETVLRDAQQSLLAGRLRNADILPAVEQLDRVGYAALDAWGGATFAACVRDLQEDPWARLREIKNRLQHTPVQMLLRGQALVGRQHYADDVVQLFVERAAAGGVDVFRIYDPLNDVRNLRVAIQAAKTAKRAVQGALIYTQSPVHSARGFAALAGELVEMGCDSICVVDPSGVLGPGPARELIGVIRATTDRPLHLNANCTSGLAPITYLAAVEAGVQGLDTALSAMAWGASQPATETVAVMLAGSPSDPKLDLELLSEINHYFDQVHERYHDILDAVVYRNDINILRYQLPAAQLAEVLAELKVQKATDRIESVLQELPRVRQDMGFPPLAAPITDIVGQQAVLNVLGGKLYGTITPALRDYCRGLLGRPPGPIDPGLMRAAIGKEEAITIRPAELIAPQLEGARVAMRRQGLKPDRPEDLLTFLMVPDAPVKAPVKTPARAPKAAKAPAVSKAAVSPAAEPPPLTPVAAAPAVRVQQFQVEVDGETFQVKVHDAAATAGTLPAPHAAPAVPAVASGDGVIKAPMQGLVFKVKVKAGDAVKLGEVILILEAMKMQNDIVATAAGTVKAVHVQEGAVVSQDDPLVTVA